MIAFVINCITENCLFSYNILTYNHLFTKQISKRNACVKSLAFNNVSKYIIKQLNNFK